MVDLFSTRTAFHATSLHVQQVFWDVHKTGTAAFTCINTTQQFLSLHPIVRHAKASMWCIPSMLCRKLDPCHRNWSHLEQNTPRFERMWWIVVYCFHSSIALYFPDIYLSWIFFFEQKAKVTNNLELGQINFELLGSGIDTTHFVHCLDSLSRQTQSNITVQVFREESLPLKVDFLDLLDALVRESHHTSLTVWLLSEQIAHSCAHDHVALARRLQKRNSRR